WTFSGGGFSHVFARPSYQAGTLPAGSTAIPAASRGVPDIALQASSATGALVYLSLPPDGTGSNINQTGWYDIGGTSLSCPQWAGLVAIADQINKAQYGQTGLGPVNPALYKVAQNPRSTRPTSSTSARGARTRETRVSPAIRPGRAAIR